MNFLRNSSRPLWLSNRRRGGPAFSLLELLVVVGTLAVLTAVMMPSFNKAMAADQQGYPTSFTTLTNVPTTIAAATNSGTLNSFVMLQQGRGAAFQVKFNTSSGTSNVVYQIAPSVDGTNIESTVWPWTVTANGTTDVTHTTNWARGTLDGYKALVLVLQTNQNVGTLTNKMALFNIPNS